MKIQFSSDNQSLMHAIAVELDDVLAMNGLEDFLQIGDIEDLDNDTQALTKVVLTAIDTSETLVEALNDEYLQSSLASMLQQYAESEIEINLVTTENKDIQLSGTSTPSSIATRLQEYLQVEHEHVAC